MAKGGGIGGRKTQFLDETTRAPVARVTPGSKPASFDDVAAAFHAHRVEASRIMRLYRPQSVEMIRAFDDAKANLKTKLAEMGLADHIDWK